MCLYRLDSNGDLKVGDFGLAEDVYGTGYFKQSSFEGVKLPYKWLAIESLNDAVFNEKTDVVRYNQCSEHNYACSYNNTCMHLL